MNIEKLKPWNWFKHEEGETGEHHVPVVRAETGGAPATVSGPDSLLRMHREMDRWFNDMFQSFGMPPWNAGIGEMPLASSSGFFRPRVDVFGDDKQYEISLDVPGMTEDNLNIEVAGDMLMIKGKIEHESENKDKKFYRVERSYGSFQRTLSLPDDVDVDEIVAKLDNGVLRLVIPRREAAGKDVKRISIAA